MIRFVIKSVWLLALRLVLAMLGIFMVAIALPWSYEVPGTRKANGWYLRSLPRWTWLWGNDRDGAEGDDSRRWLDRDAVFSSKWPGYEWLNRWWWLAVRNPVNNATRTWSLFSIDLQQVKVWEWCGQYEVRDKISYEGWQFVQASYRYTSHYEYQGIYYVRRWGNTTKALVIQIGFKLYPRELENPPADEGRVSFTFEIAPFKDIS